MNYSGTWHGWLKVKQCGKQEKRRMWHKGRRENNKNSMRERVELAEIGNS